ncbi:glycosyl transferase family 1 [Erysipelothrix larvae]|uniref:Glycosyl transferase family 1 n=1 Tax=Erysipelothrix larvae TaxID=1514105 RepID=A0A0X8GXZ6_9FIRM|nr:glycosyltransferase [Erysipelothrix larvae]AMC92494.1 glycosyl transferase family 1 [Erysipelothrix larvae]
MRILLYTKNESVYSKSGIGRAMKHQVRALSAAGVDFTQNQHDDYDIVHINTVDPSSLTMIQSAKRNHKKVVIHAHSTEEDFKNSFIFSNQIAPLFKMHLVHTYKKGDMILTPTPYSKGLIESYGITKPIVAVSNGIDLDAYKKDEVKIQAFRKYFNLSETDKVVMSVGLYFERKGIHDFIEIARHFPHVKFIWFGYTSPSATTSKVKRAIKEKPDNVILPGYIAGDIIKGAYQSADLFFFPSYEETEGIVVLEALASKIQVLVRDIGVYEGWLENNKNCYMETKNEMFILKIRELLNHDCKDTIKAGYEVAKSRSIEEIGQQLKEIYERVMGL